MPVLPTTEAHRRSVQSRRGVVSDPTAGLVADTVAGVAGQAQDVFNQIQQQQDDLAYAQAKADMVVADMDARASFEGDTDHATQLERYGKAMGEARTKVVSQIRSKRDRARFEVEDKLFHARGKELVNKRVRSLARDERRATINASLESLRDVGLADTAVGTDFLTLKTARDLVNKGVAAGDFGFDEGRQMKEQWEESFAVAAVEMMPLLEQIAALEGEGTIAGKIDPDIRADMLKTAIEATDTEVTKQASQAAADEIYDMDLPLKDQLPLAREIADPSIRDMVVKRLKERHREDAVITEEDRVSNLTDAYEFVDTLGLDAIPSDLWAQMPQKDRNAVTKYAKPGPVELDVVKWYELKRMETEDPARFAGLNMLDWRPYLDDVEFKAMSEAQSKLQDGDNSFVVQLRSNDRMSEDALRLLGIKTSAKASKNDLQKAADFRLEFEQSLNALQTEQKRKATPSEKQEILDQMTVRVVTEARIWPGPSATALFEFDPADRPDVPDDWIVDLAEALEESGETVTKEAIELLYQDYQQGVTDGR